MTVKSAIGFLNWLDFKQSTVMDFPDDEVIEGLPIDNARLEEVNQVWGLSVSSSKNEFTRVFNVHDESGGSRPVGVFTVIFARRIDGTDVYDVKPMIGGSDLIQVKGFSEKDGEGETVFDSGRLESNVNPKINYWTFVVPDADVDIRSIEFFVSPLSKVDSVDEFLWISRLWCGPLIRMNRGFQTGHRKQWSNNQFGEVVRTPSYSFNRIQKIDGELSSMEMFEQMTNTKHQFLFIEDISVPSDTSMIGKRSETTGFQSQFFNHYGFNLRHEETW